MEHPDFGRICECECHRDNGPRIFCSCFGECCEFEQKKFFNEDGTVDVARFGALVMERWMREPISPVYKPCHKCGAQVDTARFSPVYEGPIRCGECNMAEFRAAGFARKDLGLGDE